MSVKINKNHFLVIICLFFFLWSCSDPEGASQDGAVERMGEITAQAGAESAKPGQSSGSLSAGNEHFMFQSSVLERLEFDPSSPVTGDQIRAVVIVDPGQGPYEESLYYRWKINGRVVQDSQRDVLDHPVQRGDWVGVGIRTERNIDAPDLLSHFGHVGNAHPSIQLLHEEVSAGGTYEARLEVSDPELDPVTVSLVNGPSGMVVHETEHVISWPISSGQEGSFPVEISARDSLGAETVLHFEIRITEEQTDAEYVQEGSVHFYK